MWTRPSRNYDGVQFATLRQAVEKPFTEAHDELSEVYYDYWRHGKSRPWRGYDVQPTPQESKALFDALHGLIEELRLLALDRHNASAAQPDSEFARYMDEIIDEGRTRRDHAREKVAQIRAKGLSLPELE